ncbi:MAG: hypothetical protein KF841_14410 [Phycisphaerae bacterium]|nr:hypothetical protein [Phycisphaerae bacterium]
MRSRLLAAFVMVILPCVAAAQESASQPGAGAIVNIGRARFTALTPCLIRLEWSADGRFEDRPSLAFIDRTPAAAFEHIVDPSGMHVLKTSSVSVRYRDNGKPFDRHNLSITQVFEFNKRPHVWTPGTPDTGNLLGTCRTLDGVNGATPLEKGILSRDGWAIVDDSDRPVFDKLDGRQWFAERADAAALDWYYFGYGHEYKKALGDFTKIAGKIPLPPRFVFGAWWSRYWAYRDAELRELVAEFKANGVPLDVLVIDMDWHLDGWTGYTWNSQYFPDPEGFLKWAHQQGLRVTLNLHPADGVGKHERAFPDVCKAMGLDPQKIERVLFDCTDPKYMDAYFKYLHHPLEKIGVDFWWMDWQQGTHTKIRNLDPLIALNHLHWQDMVDREGETGRRPLIFSRWGGLGNHRYQIGFSGDTFCNWPSLAFQPYFTATAGNVGYAYWSHDIGGHQPGPVDPELYVRWIQWGALSPILRTHTTKNPLAERRIWKFPTEYFEAARKAYQFRYELIPYIYAMARRCHDTGIPLCRPLYYEWPEMEESYAWKNQYMFGDDLLVSPVVEPADPISGCAMVEVWLPPGKWVNWFTGRRYEGPATARLIVPLDEIPLFARAGAKIPLGDRMSKGGDDDPRPIRAREFDLSSATAADKDESAYLSLLAEIESRLGPDPAQPEGGLDTRTWNLVTRFLESDEDTRIKQRLMTRLLGIYRRMKYTPSKGPDEPDTVTVEWELTRGQLGLGNWTAEVAFLQGDRSIQPLKAVSGRTSGGGLSSVVFPIEPITQTTVLEGRLTLRNKARSLTLPLTQTLLPSIGAWQILGPFDVPFAKSFDTQLPPDEKIDLAAEYEGRDGRKIKWQLVERRITPESNLADEFFIDFDDVFGGRVYESVAYALTYLDAPEDMDAVLAIGTDDGAIVRFNGEEVLRVNVGRPYTSKQDRVPVRLKKGENELFLKINQGGGDWGFCVHVESPDGNPLPAIRATAKRS